jgi:putative peptidoglycan lipid II flippase
VFLTTGLGFVFAFYLPGLFGLQRSWGTAGLTSSAGIAGWVEFMLLRRNLNSRIGKTGLELGYVFKLWISALVAAAVAFGAKLALHSWHPMLHPKISALFILAPYGILYFLVGSVFQLDEAKAIVRRVSSRVPFLKKM